MERRNLSEVLAELVRVQADNARLGAAISAREAQETIRKNASKVREGIISQANAYGSRVKKLANDYVANQDEHESAIYEYEEMQSRIDDVYEQNMNGMIEQQTSLETEEIELTERLEELKNKARDIRNSEQYKAQKRREKDLINAGKEAFKDSDFEQIEAVKSELEELQKNDELLATQTEIEDVRKELQAKRDAIKTCKEALKEWTAERKDAIQKLDLSEYNPKSIQKKMSFGQRLLGAISIKLLGGKRGFDSIIKGVRDRITHLKEEVVPQVQKEAKEKKEGIGNRIATAVENARNIGKEATTRGAEIARKTGERITTTTKSTVAEIVSRGTSAKNAIIDKMEQKIKEAEGKRINLEERNKPNQQANTQNTREEEL